MKHNTSGATKKEQAQGMVEFALSLPLLLMLFFGIIEFGRLLFFYSATVTATREAARFGSAAGISDGGTEFYKDCNGIRSAATRIGELVGIGNSDISIHYDRPEDTPLGEFADCDPAFSINVAGERIKVGDRIIIRIAAQFQPVVPLVNVPPLTLQSETKRTILEDVRVR